MQLQPWLRELLGNSTSLADLPAFVLNLVLAALLGLLLGHAYARFGHALSNRTLFARNFPLLTVTTTLIISIVKSSLALSLGLVGALSIIRFRAAIKEPEELAYLFLAISIGLGLGADQFLVTTVALGVILGFIAVRTLVRGQPDPPNLYVTVTTPAGGTVSASQILEALTTTGARARLTRFDQTPDSLEASFLVDFKEVHQLERFSQQLRQLSPAVRVSCLEGGGMEA